MIAASKDWYMETIIEIYKDYDEYQIVEIEDC